MFATMTSLQAGALYCGLLILVMLGLKMYVGAQRGRLKVEPGDVGNIEFGRATRVQLNAVEDVPPLMVGILLLGLLNLPAYAIHITGGLLTVSRILHAVGLAGSGGFSIGRALGTLGTLLTYLAVAGGLIIHAFVN